MRSSSSAWRRRTRRLGILAGLCLLAGCSDRGSPRAEEDAVLARWPGEVIRASEARQEIAFQIYRKEVDIYSLLERETMRLVDERLLAREAAARGVTPEALLRAVADEADPVSEGEIDSYLRDHPSDVPPGQARPRVRHYLEETRREERRLALLARLRERAGVEILLTPPEPPRVEVDTRGAPARGPADAPVTLVHFAALTSPRSAHSAQNLAKLRAEFGDRLRFVHRHYLLERDELGLRAAQLAVVAQAQGRFWSLHDRLFSIGDRVDESVLAGVAEDLGLAAAYEELPGDRETLLAVRRDIAAAHRVGVRSEPTLFVNGRFFMGLYPLAELRKLVQEELASHGAGG
jgi:protein-disulfide isomerase